MILELYAKNRCFFPDPAVGAADGLIALSDDLDVSILFEAYSFGIFPWPQEEELPILWFSPMKRGILDLDELHIPKSLKKTAKKSKFEIRFNTDFDAVIQACAEVDRPDQDGTWVTSDIINAYKKLHRAGYAHSIECWDGERLVGAMYGVYIAGVFSGESMFYKESNASKLCFWTIAKYLKSQGVTWMDLQMVTPNVATFGGKYISRSQFLKNLEVAKSTACAIDFKNRTFSPSEFLY